MAAWHRTAFALITAQPTCPRPRSLVKGSILGCIGIVLVVFFVAFCGILAAWAGLLKDNIMALPEGYNLYFFAVG